MTIDVIEAQQLSATQPAKPEFYVAGPLTAGETVTVTGTANPLMVSCIVAGIYPADSPHP